MMNAITKTVSFSVLVVTLSLVPMMDVLLSSRLHPLFIENSLTQKMQLVVLAMVALLYGIRSLPVHQDRVLMMQMMLLFKCHGRTRVGQQSRLLAL